MRVGITMLSDSELVLRDEEIQKLGDLVGAIGEERAAKHLKVSRLSVVRALCGRALRLGTLTLIRINLSHRWAP